MLRNKSFEALLEGFNAYLKAMTDNGYPLWDTENPEFFISNVFYNSETDQIEFQTTKERKVIMGNAYDSKKKLNECVTLYGPLDRRTLEASRKVDEIIVKEMREVNI